MLHRNRDQRTLCAVTELSSRRGLGPVEPTYIGYRLGTLSHSRLGLGQILNRDANLTPPPPRPPASSKRGGGTLHVTTCFCLDIMSGCFADRRRGLLQCSALLVLFSGLDCGLSAIFSELCDQGLPQNHVAATPISLRARVGYLTYFNAAEIHE